MHPQLSRIMGEIGHTDLLCVCDAGFPVPQGVERVDLAWKQGEPAWLDVCRMIRNNMVFDKIYLAIEMKPKSPAILAEFLEIFKGVEVEFISHADLKKMSKGSRAVVRTGEFSAYCNCVFVCGCNF